MHFGGDRGQTIGRSWAEVLTENPITTFGITQLTQGAATIVLRKHGTS